MLSVGQILENGFKHLFEINYCQIKYEDSNNLFTVMMKRKSFTLDSLVQEQKTYYATKINAEVQLI
uniref:Putative ovule protein n=1 Tax=Solanum chacoense TaxID=4108 RepID=A0A0V0HBL6_SOLCH